MVLNEEIERKLKESGAGFVCFVDVAHLPEEQNRTFPHAVLFGIPLSPGYVQMVNNTPDYVRQMIENNADFSDDEFSLTELKTGELSDRMSAFLTAKGYKAYSLSDENQLKTGSFDEACLKTPMPHKTVALLAGIGFIGKNNLLTTPAFGSALCLGVVLTDAPLKATRHTPEKPKCKNCSACINACEPDVLKGVEWSPQLQREDIVDISRCTTCMNCLVICPWTQRYMNSRYNP